MQLFYNHSPCGAYWVVQFFVIISNVAANAHEECVGSWDRVPKVGSWDKGTGTQDCTGTVVSVS